MPELRNTVHGPIRHHENNVALTKLQLFVKGFLSSLAISRNSYQYGELSAIWKGVSVISWKFYQCDRLSSFWQRIFLLNIRFHESFTNIANFHLSCTGFLYKIGNFHQYGKAIARNFLQFGTFSKLGMKLVICQVYGVST